MELNWAQDAGIYEFIMGADGSTVKARFTPSADGSIMLSPHVPARACENELQMGNLSFFGGNKQINVDCFEANPITKEEVRGMFQLWNNALTTVNSDLVASHYVKEVVLLPTVSDTPHRL